MSSSCSDRRRSETMGVLECRQRDMTRGWTGVVLWCLPVVALVASAPMGDTRWWIWTPSLIIMGTACVANAARCGRRHCYLAGPALLGAAGLSVLRGVFHTGLSWNWISGTVVLVWIAGCLLEWSLGSYRLGSRPIDSA